MNLLKRGIILIGLKGINSALGFCFTIAIAMTLGANKNTDALIIAMFVPVSVGQALIPFFSMLLVPLIVSENGKNMKANWPAGLGLPVILVVTAISLFFIIFPQFFVGIMGKGLPPDARETAEYLFRLLLPAFVLTVIFALCHAMFYAQRKFYRPEAGRLLWRLTALTGLFTAGQHWGAEGCAWSILAASVIRLAPVLPGPLKFRCFWKLKCSENLKIIIGVGIAALAASMIFDWGMQLAVRAVASTTGQGDLTIMDYADKLAKFAPLLLAQSFFSILLPEISALQKKGMSGAEMAGSISLMLFAFGIPLSGIIYFTTPYFAKILCERSRIMFDSYDALVFTIRGYAIGIPAVLGHMSLKGVYLIQRDLTEIIKTGLIQSLSLAAGLCILYRLGLGGIALSVSIASWCTMIYLLYRLKIIPDIKKLGLLLSGFFIISAGFCGFFPSHKPLYFITPLLSLTVYFIIIFPLWNEWQIKLTREYAKTKGGCNVRKLHGYS